MNASIPAATYRLQLGRELTFAQAASVVPYLQALGISHAYTSPYLKARPGSRHGYDIVDHQALNPEIDDGSSYDAFVQALRQHGMGHIFDLVPNHMGVGGDDNAWWLEVLEHGPASPHAGYFDIDWHPLAEKLRGKLLVPMLGDHYGRVLENGELRLAFDAGHGAFSVFYYNHRFPIDPRTYVAILEPCLHELPPQPRQELSVLTAALARLPSHHETGDKAGERLTQAAALKAGLAAMCATDPRLQGVIDARVASLAGVVGTPRSFDALHRLLEQQAYRLAYWQTAADEVNYRRFLDINDVAGLRTERAEVFEATHAFVLALVAGGRVQGLRIDHPDGLYDPESYFRCLKQALSTALDAPDGPSAMPPLYVVVEKILAPGFEHLPEGWPVHGTTGYDFMHLLNGLFVDPRGQGRLQRLHVRFSEGINDFDELLYACKKRIMAGQLGSELTVLANLLGRIAESDRRTRDFTPSSMRSALTEIVACFPVYRTYVRPGQLGDDDRRYIEWAVAQAKKRGLAADTSIFDFIAGLLLLEHVPARASRDAMRVRFAMKFQQYTAPVMVKAMEDTAFYLYIPLLSLNEVGGDPRLFGISVAAFHHANGERLQRRPHAMNASSTHDSKLSEDVRARLNVLSELPDEWRRLVQRWHRLNRRQKRQVNGVPAPGRHDEYLLYQVLLGSWPLEEGGQPGFCERITAYMRKAVREAKLHSSWINPDPDYEQAVEHFIRQLLDEGRAPAFLDGFAPFQRRVAFWGMLNSLAQALLRFMAPGVPDLYQGNEVWNFRLVDPDNRQPVDFARCRHMLQQLQRQFAGDRLHTEGLRTLLAGWTDGRAKLYLSWRALQLRTARPALFESGEYLPLAAEGGAAAHVCAFARRHQHALALAVAPRLVATLMGERQALPLGAGVWSDTRIEVPADVPYRDVLSGRVLQPRQHEGRPVLALADLLAHFPVALLQGE